MKKILIITLIFSAITFGLTAQALMSVDESNRSNVSQPVKMGENVPAPKPVEVYFFKVAGCPHCESLEAFLDSLQQEYPALSVKKFDLRADPQNVALCQKLVESCNVTLDQVPMTFIGTEVVVGDRQIEVRQKIEQCLELGCPSPIENISKNTNGTNINPSASSGSSDTNNPNPNQSLVSWIILGILGLAIVGFIIFLKYR